MPKKVIRVDARRVKKSTSAIERFSGNPPVMKSLSLRMLVLLTLFAPFARAQQNTTDLDIGVRSGIDMDEHHKRKADVVYAKDIGRHASVYLLASVMPHPSIGSLVREVNAIAIAK